MMTSFLISTITIVAFSYFYLKNEEQFTPRNQQLTRERPRKRGLALYGELQRINRHYLSSGREIELPRYKFFTELCDELLLIFRREGADIFPHLIGLRKNLGRDLKAEKGLQSTIAGAFLEMGVITLLSVLIFGFARYMAMLPIEANSLLFALGVQGLGYLALGIGGLSIKHRTFRAFQSHITSASLCDLGIRTSMPINKLAKRADLQGLEPDKDLSHVRERLNTILRCLKAGNLGDLSQSEEAVEECWMVYDTKLARYHSRLRA